MGVKTKKKLCWNCEGDVVLNAANCSFCGVSLEVAAMEEEKKDPFAPPYRLEPNPDQIPTAPYPLSPEAKEEQASKDPRSLVLGLTLLLLGSTCALFSLILWLFSSPEGILTLRWNGNYWFVYLLVSLPMLYLGWKTTQKEE